MAKTYSKIHTAHVAEPQAEDRQVILELHELGRAFQNAVGAYMSDNPSKFPKGTLTKILTSEENDVLKGLLNGRSHVNHNTMSAQEMEDHSTYYGTHLHCLFMKTEERYLESLSVPFNDIVDSIDVDVSDKAAVNAKLDVCERYGFQPIAELLMRKLSV